MKIRRNETLRLEVEADSSDEISVEFIIAKLNYDVVYVESFEFVDKKAYIVIPAEVTRQFYDEQYYYQWTVTLQDGSKDIYPEAADCEDGDCGLPILEVCKSLDDELAPIVS